MKKIKINGRIMEEKIKYGWTISGLAQHYGVSEEEFLAILNKNFSRKAVNQMIARLRKNEKRISNSITEHTTKLQELTKVIVDYTLDDNLPTEKSTLDILTSQKAILEELINSKELEHKKLSEKRNKIRGSVTTYEKQLLKLQKEVSNCKAAIEDLEAEYDNTYEKMQALNHEIAETRASLIKIDDEIKLNSKISIFVFESGEISFETPYDIDISDKWKKTYDDLVNNEELENLTVKQIKTLAQCLTYIKFFTEKNIPYEFIFENQIIEEYFKGLVE